MKRFTTFALGFVFGAIVFFGILKIRELGDIFWGVDVYESSSKARGWIESRGVPLPAKAYDLGYYLAAGRDSHHWMAFSASNKEIESIIPAIIRGREFVKGTKGVPDKPEYWAQESTTGNWWPDSSKGLVTYNGDLFWIGHDTTRGRLYYYTFSN